MDLFGNIVEPVQPATVKINIKEEDMPAAADPQHPQHP